VWETWYAGFPGRLCMSHEPTQSARGPYRGGKGNESDDRHELLPKRFQRFFFEGSIASILG